MWQPLSRLRRSANRLQSSERWNVTNCAFREARGSLSVNSASGDVLIREVGSPVSINTASGDQTIGAVTNGSVGLKSASGDLKVGIREGSTLWVDARSRSGEVSSELPVTDLPPEGDAPHIELRANTMSGDITLVRA